MRKHSYQMPHSKAGGHASHDAYHAQQHSAHKAKMGSLHSESCSEMSKGESGNEHYTEREASVGGQHEPTSGKPINQHKQLAGVS